MVSKKHNKQLILLLIVLFLPTDHLPVNSYLIYVYVNVFGWDV